MIQVKNLTKEYVTYKRGHTFADALLSLFKREKIAVRALHNVSFEIAEGELIGLLGPNGAGKSTTIKILTGVLFPTSGNANCNSYTPWKQRKKYVKEIGAVFGQKSQLIFDIPPVDAFYMNRSIYDIPTNAYEKRLSMMVELLDIGDIIQKPTRGLSLGERMKCEFVMAMLHNPKIVFLDEPTIGLDVIAKEKIRSFIKEMNAQGTTFILTTHDLDDVEHLVDRVITINHGEVVFDGKLKELKRYLGDKKIVHLTTNEPLPQLDIAGVVVRKKISNYECEIELDLSVKKMAAFIKYINDNATVKDITIHDLPLEDVIKNLYLLKK